MKSWYIQYPIVLFLLILSFPSFAQSPGIIVRPAGTYSITSLNTDGNAYSSKTTSGFVSNDIAESEVAYKIVPPAVLEPTGDLATGPSGGFSDIVKTVDGSGFYIYKDATNLYFRLRIGSIISGSKGYSVLIDTDGKMGNTGANADDKYIAPTNTSNGNPGFEYEVVFRTNFDVTVYNVDGTTSPVAQTPVYALSTNSQISVALSTDGNNPDYFYDWFVPLSSIGNPASIRMVATTVTSPTSALQGSRSDIYGIDDAANTNVASAWSSVVNAQPSISLTNFSTYTTSIGSTCTAAPTLNTPINIGANISVAGTWTRMDASKPSTATITLYKNGVAVSTISINTTNNWSITVPVVSMGDVFFAKAQSTGESMCLESNAVKVIGCSPATTSTITGLTFNTACFNDKGMEGTRPSGAAVILYTVTSNGTPTLLANDATTTYKITYPTLTTWRYDGQYSQGGQSACNGGQGDIANAQYMITATEPGKCESARVNACLGLTSQIAPVISQAILTEANTIISGTVATTGSFVRLYINGVLAATTTAVGTNYSFSNLSLQKGNLIEVRAQAASQCLSATASKNVVCFTEAPFITTLSSGGIAATMTSISGISSYPGSTLTLYKGVSPSGTSVGAPTVSVNGLWTVSPFTLAAAETYYAVQTINGCSASSSLVTINEVTSICPTIAGSYTENTTSASGGFASNFTGTVRLYLDDVQIGNVAVSNVIAWSIPSFMYPLYSGGQLTVRAQTGTAAETIGCPSAVASVTCTSPAAPSFTPIATSNITVGQSVTYTINNANASTWYSIQDNTGKSYATTIYKTDNANFSITTNSINTAATYDLKISADKLTGCAASFATAKIVASHVVLPVRFVDVSVKSVSQTPQVTWQVADEQNVSYYSIERSDNGSFFEESSKMEMKLSAGTTNQYVFNDKNAAGAELLYYRIKQVDNDGKYAYSKIVSLKLAHTSTLQLIPNPAFDKTVVQVSSNKQQKGWLQLVNTTGIILKNEAINLKKGSNQLLMDGLQQYRSGTYFIKVVLRDGTLYKKLLLQ